LAIILPNFPGPDFDTLPYYGTNILYFHEAKSRLNMLIFVYSPEFYCRDSTGLLVKTKSFKSGFAWSSTDLPEVAFD